MRFSRLAWLARDRVSEIDVNPLMVRDGALIAADALVVVDCAPGTDAQEPDRRTASSAASASRLR